MPGRARRRAAHQWNGRKHRGVRRAAAEHDVGARIDRGDVGLGAQQRDDMRAGIETRVVDHTRRRKRGDLALARLGLENGLVLFGIDDGDVWRDGELAREFENDIHRPIKCPVAARGAARSDQQWNLRDLTRRQ